jgi:hypothetical protein
VSDSSGPRIALQRPPEQPPCLLTVRVAFRLRSSDFPPAARFFSCEVFLPAARLGGHMACFSSTELNVVQYFLFITCEVQDNSLVYTFV